MKSELAALLTELRRGQRQQSGLKPGLVPPDTATAYDIAAMVARELGWSVGGWKIAAMKEEMQRALRTDAPIYGRVYRQFVVPSPVTLEWTTLLRPLAEIEYAALLALDLPPRSTPYSQDEVGEAVASLHPGMEIA